MTDDELIQVACDFRSNREYRAVAETLRALAAERDALRAENERLREVMEWQADAIEASISENDVENHRLFLNGKYHTGPVVDWVHAVITKLAKINRTALKGATHD